MMKLSQISLYFFSACPTQMASAGTPKKLYVKSTPKKNISRCRLCNSVQDPKRCKNLFGSANKIILQHAEAIYTNKLPQFNGFPHLICRPCERRLNNAIAFKKCISETQKSLADDTRSKRCIEQSPSAVRPAANVVARESRRRSIDFSGAGASVGDESQHDTLTTSTVSFSIFTLLNLFIVYTYYNVWTNSCFEPGFTK